MFMTRSSLIVRSSSAVSIFLVCQLSVLNKSFTEKHEASPFDMAANVYRLIPASRETAGLTRRMPRGFSIAGD
jgi:hypothetical protein